MVLKVYLRYKKSGKTETATFRTEAESFSIGRRNCDIQLDSPTCSRTHAVLTYVSNSGLVLLDLGSTNGTRLNGRKVRRIFVKNGDVIQIGEVTLIIVAFMNDDFSKSNQQENKSRISAECAA